jgi:flagellar biosynthesis/type III secretory pathway M-ring protein FliF/YscJ
LVKGAVGYNEQRGDRIDVAVMPFGKSSAVSETIPAPGVGERLVQYIPYGVKYGAILLGISILVIVVLRPLLKNLEEGGKRIEEIQRSLPQAVEGMTKKLGDKATTEQFVDLVRQDSKKAAQIVRMWLKEG